MVVFGHPYDGLGDVGIESGDEPDDFVLQFQRCLAGGVDLPNDIERHLAVLADPHHLVQAVVLPKGHLQDIFGADLVFGRYELSDEKNGHEAREPRHTRKVLAFHIDPCCRMSTESAVSAQSLSDQI